VRLAIPPAGATPDARPAGADAGPLPPPALAELWLMVAGPGLAARETALDARASSFELELPAGSARTISIVGKERRGAELAASWSGSATLDLRAGQSVELVLPVVPAGTLAGALYVAGQRLALQAEVRLAADSPRPYAPAAFVVQTDAGGAFSAVLPTGFWAVTLSSPEPAGLRQRPGGTRAQVAQGTRIAVPLELFPSATLAEPATLALELVGGALAGLPAATPADLLVRVRDARGAAAPLSGTVTFEESDLALLRVPADARFAGESERRLGAAVSALVGVGAATLRARVRERPEVRGALALNILAVGTAPGPAVALRLALPSQKLPTGLSAKAVDLELTALDAAGLVATGYRGTVGFSASDPLALLVPADYSFRAEDAGTRTLAGALRGLGLPGTGVTLFARDRASPSIAGQLSVMLSP
jgi:hypothetical protein